MKNRMHKKLSSNSRMAFYSTPIFLMLISILMGGCALNKCLVWNSYEKMLNNCVGQNVSCYTSEYRGAKLKSTTQLAQNRILYNYTLYEAPTYLSTTGQLISESSLCKTKLTINNSTGEIINWSYVGDCNNWSYCAQRER